MTDAEAKVLVGTLVAAYPTAKVTEPTVRLYAQELQQMGDYDDVAQAVLRVLRTSGWWPPLEALWSAVVEQRLGLPGPAAAWQLAVRYASHVGEREPCTGCDGRGYSDIEADEVCRACKGVGTTPRYEVELAGPLRDAIDSVGGEHALRTGDHTVLRGQFWRAYTALRAEALHRAMGLGSTPATAPATAAVELRTVAAPPTDVAMPELRELPRG